jgi:hypothetical protein
MPPTFFLEEVTSQKNLLPDRSLSLENWSIVIRVRKYGNEGRSYLIRQPVVSLRMAQTSILTSPRRSRAFYTNKKLTHFLRCATMYCQNRVALGWELVTKE